MPRSLFMPGSALSISLLALGWYSTSQGQVLQPESRRELQRSFGSSGAYPSSGQPRGTSQTLRPETQEELSRTFGQQLERAEDIRLKSTPETTSQMQQLPLLRGRDPKTYVLGWHKVALDVTAVDHSPLLDRSPATFHRQFGPARTARALALVHLAMFEAANRLNGTPYKSMLFDEAESPRFSLFPFLRARKRHEKPGDPDATAAAVTEAAFQVLVWLYPGLTDTPIPVSERDERRCDKANAVSLRDYNFCALKEIELAIGDHAKLMKGVAAGREVAERIIDRFSGDGSDKTEPVFNQDFVPRTVPSASQGYSVLQWQIDPVSKLRIALGGRWPEVRPVTLTSSFQFRKSEADYPVRALGTDPKKWPSFDALLAYAGEYRLNSEGLSDPAMPKRDGYFIAQTWAYDATAGLCAPARLYNQIADAVLEDLIKSPANLRPSVMDANSVIDLSRFYALVNIALADAAIAAWDSKYYFQLARPVTVIREVNANPGKLWFPIGAQVSNSDDGKNLTPPFPSYPSGHAVFGGALFGVLRQYVSNIYKTFNFISDEFNGRNRDVYNYIRCEKPSENPDHSPGHDYAKFCARRQFTLDCAERENADSRVFMGVHWIFDADDGIEMGNQVAKQVVETALLPKHNRLETVRFSANLNLSRSDLVCPEVAYPDGWEVKFDNRATKYNTSNHRVE